MEALVGCSMRTTLKRGLGRGAALNGNGKPVLPPGARHPSTLPAASRPPRSRAALIGRIALWLGVASLVLVSGAAGGAYLYFHQSVAAVAAQTPEVKRAARASTPLPGQPAVALVIGYDHRREDGANASGRSDTLMLVRADPSTDSISLLSFPRDMRVEIRCEGRTPYFDKIAHAYSAWGPGLLTVKALTGIPVNYLITVNFRGFRQIIDRLGAWIDVDRRYFNDRGGPSGYAKINLRPGYQQLTGRQGARLRSLSAHRLGPLPRRAPAAVREGVQRPGAGELRPFALPKVVNAITNNVEVAQGGGSDVRAAPSFPTRCSPTGCPGDTSSRTRSRDSRGSPS